MTENIRRLCRNIALSMKFYIVESDWHDDEWIAEFARSYLRVESLKHNYVSDSITLDEFELLVGLVLGLSL